MAWAFHGSVYDYCNQNYAEAAALGEGDAGIFLE